MHRPVRHMSASNHSCARIVLVVAALASAGIGTARADESEASLVVELSLLDAPRVGDLDGLVPTWRQASELSQALVELGHFAVHQGARRLGRARLPVELVGAALFTYLAYGFPGGPGWAHEEGHRAVMARHGIHSVNELSNPFRAPVADDGHKRVYGMSDDELARLKAEDPGSFVRMHAAGLETQIHIGREIEKDVFFSDQPSITYVPFQVFNRLATFFYFQACLDISEEDLQTEADLPVEFRDFTGPDCTAWVYDLARPDEPYAARGTFPDGGVRRPRATADLSQDERDFLALNRSLALLNFVDPMALGLPALRLGALDRIWRVSAGLEHQPTSFGGVVSLNGLARAGNLRLFGALRGYFNEELPLPGVTVQVVRYSLPLGFPLVVSPRLDIWLQPRDFHSRRPSPGGMLELTVATPIAGPLGAFVALDGKTAGWVSAHPSLGPAVDLLLGVQLEL